MAGEPTSAGSRRRVGKLFRILSIDGGGIRGIIPGMVLVRLERHLQETTGNEDARIADYFDLVAGTSTGGILACGYLMPGEETPQRPRYQAQELVNLYLDHGGQIFSAGLWHRIRTAGGVLDEKYPADHLETALEERFGDTRLSQLLRPCLITAYDIRGRETRFFTQHDARGGDTRDFRVRDVARATSAAPTYFEVANIESGANIDYPFIDGGVFANNPTMCAYAEARHSLQVKSPKDMFVLSLGTGKRAQDPIEYAEAKDWGLAEWAKPVIQIMQSAVQETVHYQMERLFDSVPRYRGPGHLVPRYVRIDAELQYANPAMDDATPENLDNLRGTAVSCIQQHDKLLKKIAAALVSMAPQDEGEGNDS